MFISRLHVQSKQCGLYFQFWQEKKVREKYFDVYKVNIDLLICLFFCFVFFKEEKTKCSINVHSNANFYTPLPVPVVSEPTVSFGPKSLVYLNI